jgi:hypothetical protein
MRAASIVESIVGDADAPKLLLTQKTLFEPNRLE